MFGSASVFAQVLSRIACQLMAGSVLVYDAARFRQHRNRQAEPIETTEATGNGSMFALRSMENHGGTCEPI